MPHIENFPHIFAVIRGQAIQGPCIQILQSEQRNDYSFIQNLRRPDDFFQAELRRVQTYQLDPTIYTLHYKTDQYRRQPAEVKFWCLPFYYRIRNERIPLIEFQYRSWIPDDYVPVPLRHNANEILHICERIEMERLFEIRREEDRNRDMYRPPMLWGGEDDWDDRSSVHTYRDFIGVGAGRSRYRTPSPRRDSYYPPPRTPSPPPTPPQPVVRIVPVERIVTQVRAQPIPKHIGDILLANARRGTDSCPIAALTFSECDKICVSSCFHIFDKESLERWMTTSTSCPVCRSKIENVVSEGSVDAV